MFAKNWFPKPSPLEAPFTKPAISTISTTAGKDKDGNIAPKILFSLEECMEYIQADECIEVTPNFIRMRKKILSEEDRKRAERNAK